MENRMREKIHEKTKMEHYGARIDGTEHSFKASSNWIDHKFGPMKKELKLNRYKRILYF